MEKGNSKLRKGLINFKNKKIKVHELDDNVFQHDIFTLGKKLLVIVGFTDNCYSQFCNYDEDGNKRRITEDLVLNDPNAKWDSPNRWVRYKFRKVFTLPFNVAYCWEGSDKIFKIKPTVWIRGRKTD